MPDRSGKIWYSFVLSALGTFSKLKYYASYIRLIYYNRRRLVGQIEFGPPLGQSGVANIVLCMSLRSFEVFHLSLRSLICLSSRSLYASLLRSFALLRGLLPLFEVFVCLSSKSYVKITILLFILIIIQTVTLLSAVIPAFAGLVPKLPESAHPAFGFAIESARYGVICVRVDLALHPRKRWTSLIICITRGPDSERGFGIVVRTCKQVLF